MDPMGGLNHVHLLLVEDNAGDVRLVREALRLGGQHAEISVARDGTEALSFLRREAPYSRVARPDLVLLDLNLPKKNGREVLSEIKTDAELCEIPVVILTTSSSAEDILFSYRCHANTYIIKPVTLDQYIEMVRGLQEYWTRIARLPPGESGASLGGMREH
ncbi:MAG: response regulator [Methanoregulaceae archaeon]